MFRPQIQKTRMIVALSILIMLMVYWAENSYERIPNYSYDLKIKASKLMEQAIEVLRQEYIARNINFGIDSLSFGSFLVGPSKSNITTTRGSKDSKQTVLNPDFSAMIVQMLVELDINSGDVIALSYTGSYPGANIATLSALEVLGVSAIITSSCGSSEYGATHPNFNWIDIEKYFNGQNFFSNKSSLASIGGELDLGLQLNSKGRETCESSIYSSDLELLNIGDPNKNLEKRISFFNKGEKSISAFINIGGGVFSVGDSLKRSSLPAGIIYPDEINIDSITTTIEYFLDNDIPAININHINMLAEWYELPYPPNNRYKFGLGSLFYSKKMYNPISIIIAFLVATSCVLIVGIKSHNEIKRRMHSSEPESFI